MKIFGSVLCTVLLLFSFVFEVLAQPDEIVPKISKYDTDVLFDESNEFNSRQLLIKFKTGTAVEEQGRILHALNLKKLSNINKGNFTLVSVANGAELENVARKLLQYTQIEYVEPNYQMDAKFTPKDPKYSKQWYLKKIQMPKAWDMNKGESSVTVAIIDGGVQTSHPELKGKIVSPYDVISGKKTIIPDDHATHVAGIIAATINNAGIAGIAPKVKIMPVNVFNGNSADVYNVVEGIIYAADRHADIINLSIGSRHYSYALEHAVNYAASKGSLIVAAAGNEDTYIKTYPAALPFVLGVSATDRNDLITNFSNYGSYIDLSAPGEDIYSTISGSSYKSMDGTSMASPVVSGVAALILSKNPLLTPGKVEKILTRSAVDLGLEGWDSLYGYGRVDAYKALSNTPEPIHSISVASSTFSITGKNTNKISFSAQADTNVSLYIQNTRGKTVKKLISNKKWNGGKVTSYWDGKQDNGSYVSNGNYQIVFKVTNGRKTIYKKAAIKTIDKTKPSIKVAASVQYSPPVKSRLIIPYEVNTSANVTAIIYDHRNKEVKKLLNGRSVKPGKQTVEWDGKTRTGKKASDGTYTLVMSVVDSRKVKGTTRKTTIKVDSKKPTGKATIISPTFKSDGKLKSGAKLKFEESVFVSAYVKTDKGNTIKKLSSEKVFKKGTSTLYWDGRNEKNKYVNEGTYYFYIKFRDSAGNTTTIKSDLFSLQDWS